jgi:succinate dehydrogenase/fumarate reductase flavoprotein subunit
MLLFWISKVWIFSLYDVGFVSVLEAELWWIGFFGGNSTKATSGINGALTRTQVDAEIRDSVQQFYNDTLKSARDKARPDLIKVLTYKSAPAIEWLQDVFGLDLTLVSRLGGHSQPRTHRGHDAKFPGMAITYALMQRLEDLAEAQPHRVTIIKKAHVKKINSEGNTITGVDYERDGKTYTENGPVVIATGGYAADFTENSLLKKYRPDVYGLATTNGTHATGDGQKMVIEIGGNGIDMDKVQVHPTGLVDPKDPDSKWKFLAAEGKLQASYVDLEHETLTIYSSARRGWIVAQCRR